MNAPHFARFHRPVFPASWSPTSLVRERPSKPEVGNGWRLLSPHERVAGHLLGKLLKQLNRFVVHVHEKDTDLIRFLAERKAQGAQTKAFERLQALVGQALPWAVVVDGRPPIDHGDDAWFLEVRWSQDVRARAAEWDVTARLERLCRFFANLIDGVVDASTPNKRRASQVKAHRLADGLRRLHAATGEPEYQRAAAVCQYVGAQMGVRPQSGVVLDPALASHALRRAARRLAESNALCRVSALREQQANRVRVDALVAAADAALAL